MQKVSSRADPGKDCYGADVLTVVNELNIGRDV